MEAFSESINFNFPRTKNNESENVEKAKRKQNERKKCERKQMQCMKKKIRKEEKGKYDSRMGR